MEYFSTFFQGVVRLQKHKKKLFIMKERKMEIYLDTHSIMRQIGDFISFQNTIGIQYTVTHVESLYWAMQGFKEAYVIKEKLFVLNKLIYIFCVNDFSYIFVTPRGVNQILIGWAVAFRSPIFLAIFFVCTNQS